MWCWQGRANPHGARLDFTRQARRQSHRYCFVIMQSKGALVGEHVVALPAGHSPVPQPAVRKPAVADSQVRLCPPLPPPPVRAAFELAARRY